MGHAISDCHVISDELVFKVKFIGEVCSEQKNIYDTLYSINSKNSSPGGKRVLNSTII